MSGYENVVITFLGGSTMRRSICLVVVALMVLLAGCEDEGAGQAPAKPASDVTVVTSANFERVAGMQWILKQMVVDGVEQKLEQEVPFVEFKGGGLINGSASINKFFGTYNIDAKGVLAWPGEFGSTRMAGPENLMKQETVFLKALPLTQKASIEGIFLTLTSDDGNTKLLFYVPVE